MKELDMVALNEDLPTHGLRAGDVGTIVHAYESGVAYEVEFVRTDGDTIAVVTLSPKNIRALDGPEILHARRLTSA
jgi:hypothetical protein